MNRKMLFAAAGLVCSSLAVNAAALDRTIVLTTHVAYGDLDLSTRTGARAMLRRIDAAATRMCEQPRSPSLPRVPSLVYRCSSAAVAKAVARLNAPMVTAEYEGGNVGVLATASAR